MSFLSFNAEAVKPRDSFEPIPAGRYQALIDESEVVSTKSGSGQMLILTWKVLEGEFKGRLVFDRLNIQNQSKMAEEIAQRQLSTLCHAVGVLQLKTSEQLHGIPCTIKVVVRKDESGQYADQNEVKDYRSIDGVAQVQRTPVPVAPEAGTQPAKSAKAAPPWAANK